MFVYVLFYLGQLGHFPSRLGASSFLLPRHYCGLEAGSIPLRAIVNKSNAR